MRVLLEEATPQPRSIAWRAHEAYYPSRGGRAWTSREVPSIATTSAPFAREQALLLLEVAAGLERGGALAPGAPVHVLEVGAGSGRFAAALFLALERSTGAAGRALARRLRLALSDYAPAIVRDAVAAPRLSSRAITPALLDVRAPERLTDLEGRPLEGIRFAAAFAGYVCCATPAHTLRREGDRFLERWLRASIEAPEGGDPAAARAAALDALARGDGSLSVADLHLESEWREADLDALLGAAHAGAVRAATARLAALGRPAALHHHAAFLDALLALAPRMLPGAVALVHDYGSGDPLDLTGRGEEAPPTVYGGSLNHDVCFVALEAFARRAGLDVVRTGRGIRALHGAALRYGGAPHDLAFVRLFRRIAREAKGEMLADLCAAAGLFMADGRAREAAKLFERALAIDPRSLPALYAYGEACLEAGLRAAAERAARRGLRLDAEREWRFDLMLEAAGRAT